MAPIEIFGLSSLTPLAVIQLFFLSENTPLKAGFTMSELLTQ